MEKDNLTLFHGKGMPNKMKEAVEETKNNLPHIIEFLQMNAQLMKTKYDALISEGFTEIQALELCRTLF